jgi:hypothetical protein
MRPWIAAVTAFAALGCATQPRPGSTAETHALVGGGETTLRRVGDRLFVTVRGAKPGLASLCIGDAERVEILHASAALGTAVYVRDGGRWRLARGFAFTVRDSATAGAPSEAEKTAHLEREGWLANPSLSGKPVREFEIRLGARRQLLGVTFLATDEPMSVAYWPPTMDDACRATRLLQGRTDETVELRPEMWLPLR